MEVTLKATIDTNGHFSLQASTGDVFHVPYMGEMTAPEAWLRWSELIGFVQRENAILTRKADEAIAAVLVDRDVPPHLLDTSKRTTDDAIADAERLLAETVEKLGDEPEDSWMIMRLTKVRLALADRPRGRRS